MLSWQQTAVLWLVAIAPLATPVVRRIAFRLWISIPSVILFVVFAFFNAVNFGSLTSKSDVEIFGFPYSYYDSREMSEPPARYGSDWIPGARADGKTKISPASAFGSFAAYMLLVTIWAWPLTIIELFMVRRPKTGRSAAGASSLHERPEWAR